MSQLMEEQVSMLDLAGLYGKTSLEHLDLTQEKTSVQSSKRSVGSATPALMYLDLRTGSAGSLLGASWEKVTRLHGVSSTLHITEFPSDERECTLLQIMDLNAPEKYNLSVKACIGILRRSSKRGRELPPLLKEALLEKVNGHHE